LNLNYAVPTVNRKLFVNFTQDISFIVNFLPKTYRVFRGIDLFQVNSRPPESSLDFHAINPTAGIRLIPRMEFGLVLSSISHFRISSAISHQSSAIGGFAAPLTPISYLLARSAPKQGRSRSERSDSETGESASLLARESGSEAPAWPAQASPMLLRFRVNSCFSWFTLLPFSSA